MSKPRKLFFFVLSFWCLSLQERSLPLKYHYRTSCPSWTLSTLALMPSSAQLNPTWNLLDLTIDFCVFWNNFVSHFAFPFRSSWKSFTILDEIMLQNREMLALYVLDPTPTRWLAKYLVLKEGYSSMLLCTNFITEQWAYCLSSPCCIISWQGW